eukprot:4812465-Pleurochrysis_carterae.AAC.1
MRVGASACDISCAACYSCVCAGHFPLGVQPESGGEAERAAELRRPPDDGGAKARASVCTEGGGKRTR